MAFHKKYKMNQCSNLFLLVFLQIICKTNSEETSRKLSWMKPDFQENNFDLKEETFFNYINEWNNSITERSDVTNLDEKTEYATTIDTADDVFESSLNDSSLILTDLTKCLIDYQFLVCLKMLLLTRVRNLIVVMETANATGSDFNLLQGLIKFKWTNESSNFDYVRPKGSSEDDLDRELTYQTLRLFESRSLQISLFPGLGIELTPKQKTDGDDFVCFTAKTFSETSTDSEDISEMRHKSGGGGKKKKKKKGGGFNMMPMMIIPQMIMMGMLPFALSNLKMMVMNAFMMNTMALNSMIFMTIRNLVFGPRGGSKVKYVNYGYKHGKNRKKPSLVLHSPAAFVKDHDEEDHSYSSDTGSSYVEQPHGGYPYNRRNNNKQKPYVPNAPPEVNRIVSQILQENTNGNKKHRPYDAYVTTTKSYASPNYLTNYETTTVDAPASYLNNNQYLLPTQYYNNFLNTEDQQYFSPSSGAYQAYKNMNQITQNRYRYQDDQNKKNVFSSKYNIDESTHDSSGGDDYYANKRRADQIS